MSISLGLFDVFTYMVPGSLYLSLIVYLADNLGWADISHLKSTPSLILAGAILVASYVLGHIAEPLAGALDRRMRKWKAIYNIDSRAEFIRRTPGAAHRTYVQADLMLLLAAAEANDKDAALEISRLRAVGLMLRNCSVPFLAGCVTAIAEAATGTHVPMAAVSSVALMAAALSSIRQGKRLREWANMKTLEICYWIPGIDDIARGKHGASRRPHGSP